MKRFELESKNGNKRVCYLIITDGTFVGQLCQIIDFLKKKRTKLNDIKPGQRKKLLEYIHDNQS